MNIKTPGAPALRPPGAVKRKSLTTQDEWVRESLLEPGRTLPLVVEPAIDQVDLAAWARGHRDWIENRLRKHGAILFRGFPVASTGEFETVVAAASGDPIDYRDRTSPRSLVSGKVYTSTDHPADQRILLHNENSYSAVWPAKIFFYCVQPAETGGETPLADCRRVLARLDPALVERFRERGVTYQRNFGDGLGLPWQNAFGTEDPGAVEGFCRDFDIRLEWKDGGRLRTRQVRPALLRHPVTGEDVWFNQAALFHIATLEEPVRRELLSAFAEEDLPSHALYGDGSPIDAADVAAICEAYDAEAVGFPWRKHDVLMVDNAAVAHGRSAFTGARKIVVGMAEPRRWSEVVSEGVP